MTTEPFASQPSEHLTPDWNPGDHVATHEAYHRADIIEAHGRLPGFDTAFTYPEDVAAYARYLRNNPEAKR
jgi:hypothetical protein